MARSGRIESDIRWVSASVRRSALRTVNFNLVLHNKYLYYMCVHVIPL